jgi:hypothetical protein
MTDKGPLTLPGLPKPSQFFRGAVEPVTTVQCRLLAHSVVRGISPIWSLSEQSGHRSALARVGSSRLTHSGHRACHYLDAP